MAEAFIETKSEVFRVSASGTITLQGYAVAIKQIVFLNGAATSISAQTGTITTATSTVTNAFTFTGTSEAPSQTITVNSGAGANTFGIVEYVPAGAIPSDA